MDEALTKAKTDRTRPGRADRTKTNRDAWKALPPKHRVFVDEYCIDLDMRRAGVVAGMGYSWVRQLMMQYEIKAAINETLSIRSEQAGVRAEDILRDLAIVRDKCMGRIPVTKVVKVKKQRGKKVVEVEEVREDSIWDAAGANAALQNLGRHKKLFTDVVESRSHEEALALLLDDTKRSGYEVKVVGGLRVMVEARKRRSE